MLTVLSKVSTFLILTAGDTTESESLGYQIEDDCACPDDGLSFLPVSLSTVDMCTRAYRLPALHTEKLDDTYTLAFNPLGHSGVVILSKAALNLLHKFRTPRTLVDGVVAHNDLPGGLAAAQKLVQLDLLWPTDFAPRINKSKSETLTAWLHVTNACNLRCPYCYLHKTPDQMELAHGRLSIDSIFRSAVKNGFKRVKIKYAGGEATLNMKTVLALHEYAGEVAEQHGLELDGVILSNGVALGPGMVQAIKARGLRLMISLDGVGEVHDAQRPLINGKGSFQYVERTLDRLQMAGVVPSISITITNRNLHGLADTVRYVLARRLPFSLNFYRDNECASSFADLAYSDQEIIAAMQEAFAVIEANLPRYSLLGSILDRARLDMPHDRPCGVGQSYLVIDQNGKVAKCQMEIEQTITDVNVDDPLAVVRADTIYLQNPSVEEKEGCRDCHWRYWCAGGCPALTYRMTGRFDVKSPNCNIYKALFPEVLRLEALRLLTYAQSPL